MSTTRDRSHRLCDNLTCCSGCRWVTGALDTCALNYVAAK